MFWNSELKKEIKDNYAYLFDALNNLELELKEAQGAITNLVSLLKVWDERQAKAIKVDEDWRLMADEKMNGFIKKLSDLEAFTMAAISQEQNKRIGLGERIVKLEERMDQANLFEEDIKSLSKLAGVFTNKDLEAKLEKPKEIR
jgi:hypothetical protein